MYKYKNKCSRIIQPHSICRDQKNNLNNDATTGEILCEYEIII